MVKTVILDGSELKVSGPDGDNAEIHNFGTGTVYASKYPNISADADNVIAVSPGAIDGLSGTGGTIYLMGTGKVQVNFTDEKVTKTSSAVQSTGNNGAAGVSREYVDEKDMEILAAAKEYTDVLNSGLAGYVGYTENDIYGLEADFENNRFTRLAGAVGKTAGADFDGIRAYGGRRRCNLSDSGEVLAYYGDENFKADGSNGQVMVEQPRFYYKVVPLKTEKIDGADGYHLRKARYYISDTPKAGFKVHPAFVRNGVEVDRIYLSAFEGSLFAVNYKLNDEQSADFNIDSLASRNNAKPASGTTQNLTRANARKLAQNRGAGWGITTIQTLSATQLLFAIEYATFNSQTAIGKGVVSAAEPIKTGSTSSLGNASGSVASGGVSYRGEENLWGNLWAWLDGINVSNEDCKLYITDHGFQDNAIAPHYEEAGIRQSTVSGYISKIGYSEKYDWLTIPTECKGNTALPIGDYLENSQPGLRVAVFGGYYDSGNRAGIFSFNFYDNQNAHNKVYNARLIYIPTQEVTAND